MLERLEIVRMAQAMLAHADARQGEVARNVAHADTPGYRARDLPPFAEVYDTPATLRATRPGHILAGGADTPLAQPVAGAASPNGNTVSLEAEMVRGVEIRQQHEMALAIYRNTSDILRASLGRR